VKILRTIAAIAATLTIASATPALAVPLSGMAWGEGHFGELGDGSFTTADLPTATDGVSGVVSVAAGGKHSLALLSNGTVMGWGANLFGQLCNSSVTRTDVPVAMSGVSEPSEIAAGSSDTLVLQKDGTVVACGENNLGQLGHGTIGHGGPTPVQVSGLSNVTALSAMGDSSFALLRNGTLMAWGYNPSGELGDGNTATSDVPVAVKGLSEVSAVSAGAKFALALLKNGTVMAWGYNKKGELGDGNTTNSLTPVPVRALKEVVAISAGGSGGLALLKNGTVMAWGAGGSGQLGDGSTSESDVPVPVSGLSGVAKIAAGGEFSLALLAGGNVMGWGRNEFGELGDGNTSNTDRPVAVHGLSEVAGIATGQGYGLAYGAQSPTISGPTISDVHVGSGPVSGGTTVTISGAGFKEVTAVTFGSANAASFHVTSPTAITAVSPAGTVGTVNVSVTTVTATSVLSTPDQFIYTPTIARLQADDGLPTGGARVDVTGSGFAPGASATAFYFGGTPAASVDCVSSTSCIVVAPAHAPGVVAVLAKVGGIHTPLSPADHFTYR
jgi:alpha-tubulin suppressor-like RCC1 family protein